jgi:hypothetical protein
LPNSRHRALSDAIAADFSDSCTINLIKRDECRL